MKLRPVCSVEVPFVESFGDYHEIDAKISSLQEVYGKRIKGKEIAFNGNYWGVFYVGTCPRRQELRKLLKAQGFDLCRGEISA